VNLVLEFCDWGCLRDALDAGAFFSSGSLNYAAILDTAADVAKAMLHLHCHQVRALSVKPAVGLPITAAVVFDAACAICCSIQYTIRTYQSYP
jgi:serine/threonine protein kinase